MASKFWDLKVQKIQHYFQDLILDFPGCMYHKVRQPLEPLAHALVAQTDGPRESDVNPGRNTDQPDSSQQFSLDFISDGIALITGYLPQDYLSQQVIFDQLIHPQDQAKVTAKMTTALAKRCPYGLEYRLQRRDQGWAWVLERGRGIFDATGQCVGLEGFLIDISDRKRTEFDLHRSETQHQALLTLLPDLVIHMKDDGTYLQFISGGSVQILNSNRMCKGVTIYEMLPLNLAEQRMDYIRQARETGIVQIYEYPIEIAQETRIEEARIVALPDAETLVIVRDITDRKRAEQEAQQQRQFLRCIVDTDPNLIFVKDRAGRFMLANQALADFYGTPIENILGKTSADFYDCEDSLKRFDRENQATLESGQPLFIPEEQVPSGPHAGEWLQWQKQPLTLPGSQEPCVLGIGVNITQRKRTEDWQNSKRLILEAIATAAPLSEILERLVTTVEGQLPALLGAIFILDPHRPQLRCAAAPHLPGAYRQAIDPLPLPDLDRINTLNLPPRLQTEAPFLATTPTVPWQHYTTAAEEHGLHPCALIPIISSQDELLGVFGFYGVRPLTLTLEDWTLFRTATHLAGIAIEHQQREEALRDSESNYRNLIHNLDAGVVVYDPQGRIILSNPAAAHLLGVPADELVGLTIDTAPWQLYSETGTRLPLQDYPFKQVVALGQAINDRVLCIQQGYRHRVVWVLTNAFPRFGADRSLQQVIVTFTDITQLKQAENKLRYASFHDTLTSLPNRALLLEYLDQCIQETQMGQLSLFAVVFVDLDRFKVINDSLGHLFGDQVLIQVAILLQELVRSDDLVCRFGGDEFVIVLRQLADYQAGIHRVEQIQAALALPLQVQHHEVSVAASIGVTFSQGQYQQAEDLLRDADNAMYQAKERGRNCYAVFDRAMHERAVHRLQLEAELRAALRNPDQTFELYYQPIVNRSNQPDRWTLGGFEVLIRWNHLNSGLLSPGQFLDLAEETGLIMPLSQWILTTACQQMVRWQQQFPTLAHLRLSINLAAQQLQHVGFIHWLQAILEETGVSPHNLALEVTESVLLEDLVTVVAILQQLRQLGIKISLDDFGTGYSSLNYLQQFPIDTLKIDRSFIQGLGITQPQKTEADADLACDRQPPEPRRARGNPADPPSPQPNPQPNQKGLNIVQAIVTLAHALDLKVVAEGLENAEEQRLLHSLGCDAIQGYYVALPLPQAQASQWLVQAANSLG